MTAPAESPPAAPVAGENGGRRGRRAAEEPASEPELRRGQVVSYVHRDKLPGVGEDRERMGVVLAVDELVVIRPLAEHDVTVDPEDVLGVYDDESDED